MRAGPMYLLLLMAPLLLGAARAQDETTGSVSNPPAKETAASSDYSTGFEKYYQMGLPNVREAKYVKLTMFSPTLSLDAIRMHELRLDGNAWLMGEATNGRGRFVMSSCRVGEVQDYQKLSRQKARGGGGKKSQGRDMTSMMLGEGGVAVGQWQEADLARDVARTVKFLEEKVQKREKHDGTFQQSGYGHLFLTAIHFHARGYTGEANRICDLLFQHAGDYRRVLVQALSVLASAQYEEACDRFFAGGDWAAYQNDLKILLSRYPAGWEYGRAVKLLSDRVQGRIERAEPPPLAGEGLSEEDRRLADDLAKAGPFKDTGRFQGGSRELLVLPPASPETGDDGTSHPLARIRARGIQAVPLLLALLKDDYLLWIDTRSAGGGTTHISFGSTPVSEISDAQVERQYETMRRPAARSDLAVRLLQPLIITGEDRRSRSQAVDREELYEDVKAWYGEHKGQSPVELARFYLTEGNDDQKNAAMQYLLAQGTGEDWQSIEKHLLETAVGGNRMSGMNLVTLYVTKRGADAKAFVAQYEARVRGQEGSDRNMFSDEEMGKYLERFLENLKQLVSEESLEEFLDQVASGRKNTAELSSVLWQRLSKEKPGEALGVLLKTVSKAQDARVATELLGMTMLMSRPSFMRRMRGSDEEPMEEVKLDIAQHADLWRVILADSRVSVDGIGGVGSTLGDSATYVIEALYGQQDMFSRGSSFQELGALAGDLMRRRAEARLDGKGEAELPALPSAENVTAERRKEIAAILAEAAPDAVPGKMAELNLDERLVVAEMAEENDELNGKLRPASLIIRDVKGLGPEEAEAWKAVIGKPFGMEWARRAFDETKAAVETGVRHTVTFLRQPLLGGVVISIQHGESARSGAMASSEKRSRV
ncbi:MAG: hypothetical protein KKC51_04320, partial [Verrucomicrobia bacterium]|nr:hypothetical protein [Verrucomicrobiota bacterium]